MAETPRQPMHIPELQTFANAFETVQNYDFPAKIADILMARSKIDKCSSAPSTNLLSISEKTRTILFLWTSDIVSSVVRF